jgi:hypothetical protein
VIYTALFSHVASKILTPVLFLSLSLLNIIMNTGPSSYDEFTYQYYVLYTILMPLWALVVWYWFSHAGYCGNDDERLMPEMDRVLRRLQQRESFLPISLSMIPLPLLKLLAMGLAFGFWTNCSDLFMCSVWIHQAYLNVHLVYETSLVMTFIIIAKGWSISHIDLPQGAWTSIFMIAGSFYIFNSITIVGRYSFISPKAFYICSIASYSLIYVHIINCAFQETTQFYTTLEAIDNVSVPDAEQVRDRDDPNRPLNPNHPETVSHLKEQLNLRRKMQYAFCIVVGISFFVEILCQGMY